MMFDRVLSLAGMALSLGIAAVLWGSSGFPLSGEVRTTAPSPEPVDRSKDDFAAIHERLERIENRTDRSVRDVLNLTVKVNSLIVRGGNGDTEANHPRGGDRSPAESEAFQPEGSADPRPMAIPAPGAPGYRLPEVPEQALGLRVRVGDDHGAVLAALGAPDAEDDDALAYYRRGVRVRLDEQGRVRSIDLFGQPASDRIDQNGNYVGLFEGDQWYRPARWSLAGVEVGMHWSEVLQRLGPAERVRADQAGNRALHYPRLGFEVCLSPEPDFRVYRFVLCGEPEEK